MIEMKKKDFYTKKNFLVNVDVYKIDIIVFVNGSKNEILKGLKTIIPKHYKDFNDTELDDWGLDTTEGRMIPFKGGFIVLLKAKKDYFRKFVGTLSHEMIHVCHYILRERRIPLSEDTEEAYTYLAEHLIRETLNKSY